MSEKKITIRLETKDDYRNVENLTREAFWNVYRPGCMEYYVLHCYRDDPAFVPELDFVMELDGELIGQVIYVRSEIDCDDGRKVPIMTFGPIGIAPAYKRQGYGKQLLDYSMEKAREMGAGALAMHDDPPPAERRRAVTSPNGTTQAGLEVLMDEATGLHPLIRRTVAAATALIAGLMTVIMGVVGRFPMAIASGLGLNALVASTLAPPFTWPQAMGLVVWEGIIITILVLTGFRTAVFKAVPPPLRTAISVGIVNGQPHLDLNYEEDSGCETDMNVVMTSNGGLVEVQGTAEGQAFSRAEANAMLDLAESGVRQLM